MLRASKTVEGCKVKERQKNKDIERDKDKQIPYFRTG